MQAAAAGDAVPEARRASPAAEVPREQARSARSRFGEGAQARRWRVRGLAKNLAYEVLKVNVLVASAARPSTWTRWTCTRRAARAASSRRRPSELGLREDVLKADLGRVLLKLESLAGREHPVRAQAQGSRPAADDDEPTSTGGAARC